MVVRRDELSLQRGRAQLSSEELEVIDSKVPHPFGLSKSRVMAGLQCHKLLWWMVHEPTAPELEWDDHVPAANHVLARFTIGASWLCSYP